MSRDLQLVWIGVNIINQSKMARSFIESYPTTHRSRKMAQKRKQVSCWTRSRWLDSVDSVSYAMSCRPIPLVYSNLRHKTIRNLFGSNLGSVAKFSDGMIQRRIHFFHLTLVTSTQLLQVPTHKVRLW